MSYPVSWESLEPPFISSCFARQMGKRCNNLIKPVQTYMEIKYIRSDLDF